MASETWWEALGDWWLAHRSGANTPNWDLALHCRIDGRDGLILVEAKAHANELGTSGKRLPTEDDSEKSRENHARIRAAIESAREGLRQCGAETSISIDTHYQLSNRLAFAWWLATHDVPVVLMYLGFTGDRGMPGCFDGADAWYDCVRAHFEEVNARELHERAIDVNGTPIWVLWRSIEVRLQSPPAHAKSVR